MDDRREGQRHAARAATRQRLLDATVSALAEHGVVAYSTSMTSRAAGVSHGTVFTHFGNRDELLAATAEQICGELASELESLSRRAIDHSGARSARCSTRPGSWCAIRGSRW